MAYIILCYYYHVVRRCIYLYSAMHCSGFEIEWVNNFYRGISGVALAPSAPSCVRPCKIHARYAPFVEYRAACGRRIGMCGYIRPSPKLRYLEVYCFVHRFLVKTFSLITLQVVRWRNGLSVGLAINRWWVQILFGAKLRNNLCKFTSMCLYYQAV